MVGILAQLQVLLECLMIKIALQNKTMYKPQLRWSRKGKQPSWELNYMVLSFLMNGQYYENIVGMMRLPVMAQSRWNKIITVIGTHVHVHSLAT